MLSENSDIPIIREDYLMEDSSKVNIGDRFLFADSTGNCGGVEYLYNKGIGRVVGLDRIVDNLGVSKILRSTYVLKGKGFTYVTDAIEFPASGREAHDLSEAERALPYHKFLTEYGCPLEEVVTAEK